jgi:hypothetical protein
LAVRLQLKLGAVTEQDRLPDSPDTIVVVEPSVGSVGRTKGNLYLLVTSRVPGARTREATRLVADTIRNEYYYDESAGIRQCLSKVLGIANKRLAHQRERYGLGHQPDGFGPIGVAVAVVRGRELYVATVGPAEAYLIRQARLSTLPDPNGDRGLPATDLEPEVWRGELSVGDSLCLVAANVVARVGTDTLKDALVTLHPQSAIEHLHARFVAADGRGSDGAFAFEATEVGATQKARILVPVRPDEPLAGAPDRSPIPLADSVTAGAAAIGASATRARSAAGNGFQRLVLRVQDRLPHRGTGSRRVSTASSRMETQRRAAVALLAFVAVIGALVLGIYAVGGQRQPIDAIRSITVAQQAFEAAQKALTAVSGPGVDLVTDDPKRALELLTTAYDELDKAEKAGYPSAQIAPLRRTTMEGLDRLYGVVKVASSTLFTFPAGEAPVSLAGLVRGSDGAPYVLDTAGQALWRIDLAKGQATAVLKAGQKVSGTKVAALKVLTTGGPDVLVLDVKNVLWRWRPADLKGKGTPARVNVAGSASWGADVLHIGTYVANFDAAFYKLYIVDPSEQNIMVLSPRSDGSGYSDQLVPRLPTNRPVDGITDIVIDGDIYVAENGSVARVIPAAGWTPGLPADTKLRPTSRYTLLSSPDRADGSSSRRLGVLYAYDAANRRLVAFNKANGAYLAQYQLANDDPAWAGLVAMTVLPAVDETSSATLWWISSTGLHTVPLEAAPTEPAPSPSASAPASASAKPSTVPAKTPKPTPKPTRTPKP